MQFRRRRMVVAATGFVLAIGMLVLWPTSSPVYVVSPVPSTVSGEATAADDRGALARPAVYMPDESAWVIPSSQSEQRVPPAERVRAYAPPSADRAGPGHDYAIVGTRVPGTPNQSSATARTPVSVIRSSEACTYGVAALGLCPSESEQAQPAPQNGSSIEIERLPAKDHATVRCNEAAFALGLCAQ
jgi:hypothetical protein